MERCCQQLNEAMLAPNQLLSKRTGLSLLPRKQSVRKHSSDRQLVFPNTVMGRQGLYGNDSLCSLVYSIPEE